MPKFSLILATKGRTTEIKEFLASLEEQKLESFELIIIDQNPDNRIVEILSALRNQDSIHHLRANPGVSRARNMGLALATGDIIAFPDDDCWYPAGLLNDVATWFNRNPSYGILTVTVKDRDGSLSANKWKADTCDLSPANIFRTTACYSVFLNRNHYRTEVSFDEELGPACATPFVAAEDTDFVLSLLRLGIKGAFTSRMHVGHPRRDMLSGTISGDRALSYGLGMGRVLRKHSLHILAFPLICFDLSRALTNLVVGESKGSRLCLLHGQGILKGYTARIQPADAEEASVIE
jgi:glycosyltransferase involved in cell wall biosynthesis